MPASATVVPDRAGVVSYGGRRGWSSLRRGGVRGVHGRSSLWRGGGLGWLGFGGGRRGDGGVEGSRLGWELLISAQAGSEISYDYAGAELEAKQRSSLPSILNTKNRTLHSQGSDFLPIHTHQRCWECFLSCRHTHPVNRCWTGCLWKFSSIYNRC
jgi:hypothetical protein